MEADLARWGAARAATDGRAARWDGVVPIRFADGQVVRPSVPDVDWARDQVAGLRSDLTGFDIVIWSELEQPDRAPGLLDEYARAGATWWIETGDRHRTGCPT